MDVKKDENDFEDTKIEKAPRKPSADISTEKGSGLIKGAKKDAKAVNSPRKSVVSISSA